MDRGGLALKHRTTYLRKRIKHAVVKPFAWLGIGLAWLLFTHVSHRILFFLCDLVGALYYRLDARGRKLALANLRVIRGKGPALRPGRVQLAFNVRNLEYDPDFREEIVIRRSYRNMSRTIGHIFWTSRKALERAASVARLDDASRRFLEDHKPAITVSAHLGCWEVLSQLVFMAGHPMVSVAKDIGTDAMTRLLMRSRKSIGQEIVPAEGAFRPLLQALKDGKDIGLLVDQFVRRRDGGLWVWFLGRPVCVSVAPAFLSAKTHVPIVVAWSRPLKDGTYRCETLATFAGDARIDIRGRTKEIMAVLERVIRRHPSCWVLNYRYFSKGPEVEDFETLMAEARLLSCNSRVYRHLNRSGNDR